MQFADLQASVGSFLKRADLYADVPTFIAMAEAKMNRRLRVRQMVTNATATISNEFELAPTDLLAPISLKLSDSTVLDCIAPDAMAWRKNREDYGPGEPMAYSLVGTSLEFSPVPDTTYTAFLVYYAQIPPLSVSNPSNWVLASFADAYVYGALTHAAVFLPEGRGQTFSDLFETALSEIAGTDQQDSYGARLEPRASLVV